LALYTNPYPQPTDIPEESGNFSRCRQVVEVSAFPAKGIGLGKAQMSQHAIGKFAGQFI
jgi:hypothetical protein